MVAELALTNMEVYSSTIRESGADYQAKANLLDCQALSGK